MYGSPNEAYGILIPRASEYVCNTDRASDYYGLGVRLGIYLSWFQAWIANTMLPSEIGAAADTNTVFLLTLFVAMAIDSMSGPLAQVDALVLMHLCGGATFGILSIWGYRTRLYIDNGPKAIGLFGSWGTHFRVFISLAISIYGLWFWVWGITGGLRSLGPNDGMEGTTPNAPECGVVYTFFFARLHAAGGIRYFYIFVCSGCLLYFAAMFFTSLLTAWFHIDVFAGKVHNHWSNEARHEDDGSIHRPRYVTGFNREELAMMHKFLRVMNLIWLVFSAVMVEITLNFNHIDGVLGGPQNNLSSPGQLLPLLVGAVGFASTGYQLVQDKLFNREKRSKIFRRRRFGPRTLRSTTNLDRQQEKRSVFVRYLVGWLPWLSLLQHFDEELLAEGISRQGTGFDSEPATPGLPLTPAFQRPMEYRRAPTVEFAESTTSDPKVV
ncbi:hypothetical protein B0I35DRAFT_517099 [Stachybotrys elegans]|uniref:Uncharacterized protein n=1 Tax=Stachybotrys elegans TaxID=80388 RepID=A0A8K0SE04_9HYPO|nr:hypothetical protein B0I35DRAFT_517099 [Stachybotrys elegans]